MARERTPGSAKSEPFASDADLVATAVMLADEQEVAAAGALPAAAATAGTEASGAGPTQAVVVAVERGALGGYRDRLQGAADGGGDLAPVSKYPGVGVSARAQQADLARGVAPSLAVAGVWSENMSELVQEDVAGFCGSQATAGGDLYQRQGVIGVGAPRGMEDGAQGAAAEAGAEHEVNTAERVGGGGVLGADRSGDGGEVILVGDDFHGGSVPHNLCVYTQRLWRAPCGPLRSGETAAVRIAPCSSAAGLSSAPAAGAELPLYRPCFGGTDPGPGMR